MNDLLEFFIGCYLFIHKDKMLMVN